MPRRPCVYILCDRRNGTLYIGVTSNPTRRVSAHKVALGGEFAAKHRLSRLVHIEFYATMIEAIAREKAMKEWKRSWKIELIESNNPYWRDLCWEL